MTSTDKKKNRKNQRRAYDGCRMQLYGALSLVTGRTAPCNITNYAERMGKEDATAVSQ